jgi:hypothetical protein
MLTALLIVIGTAVGAPALTYQGRAVDASGTPVNGTADVRVSLFESASAPSAFWTRLFDDEPVEDGYFAVALVLDDGGQPLDPADFLDGDVFAQLTIDGATVGARDPLRSVPFALVANGVVLPSGAAGPCAVEGALAYDGDGGLLVCDGDEYRSVVTGGTSGSEHIALNDLTFASTTDITNQGFSCNNGPFINTQDTTYMHNHNGAYYGCTRNVTGLIAGREYALTWRRSYNRQRVLVREQDAGGAVVGDLANTQHGALGSGAPYNMLGFVRFVAPTSGKVQLVFDNSPSFDNNGVTHITLRTNTRPTAPHTLLNNYSPTSAADVFASGWDCGTNSPFGSGGGLGTIHNHNGSAAYRLTRVDQVVPGQTYSVSYKKYSGNGRFSAYAVDAATLANTTLLGVSNDSTGEGTSRSFTFVAPANGLVRFMIDSASVENYGVNQLTIKTPP